MGCFPVLGVIVAPEGVVCHSVLVGELGFSMCI